MTSDGHSDWQPNYSSISDHAKLVEKQFREEEAEGLMARTSLRLALQEYGPDLTLAATGAIEKKGRTDEVRVIFDGSHGMWLNPGIRVRDQVRYPTCADGRSVLEAASDEWGPALLAALRRLQGPQAVPHPQERVGEAGLPDHGNSGPGGSGDQTAAS